VLLDVVKALESTGAKVHVARTTGSTNVRGASVTVEIDGRVVEFAVEERRNSPYLTNVTKLAEPHHKRSTRRHPLLVTPFIRPAVGDALIRAGWSWADASGNFDLRAPGLRLRQRVTLQRPQRQQRELPSGGGSNAIIRWMLSRVPLGERINPAKLMEVGGVSQPRVSQLMRALAGLGLLTREGRAYRLESIEPLLDAFLRDYQGPGGSELLAYTLDAPSRFALKAAGVLDSALEQGAYAFSADVGPDLLSSWRSPTHTIVYVRQNVSFKNLGLVEAKGRQDANVVIRMPADESLFSTVARHARTNIPLVDVPQMMWDLLDLGGEDREETVGKLREWFMQRR
jgi:hypothetical protein